MAATKKSGVTVATVIDEKKQEAAEDLLSEGTVTVAGATAEFGIGRTQLYGYMLRGELVYSKMGDRRLIPRKAIKRLIGEKLVGV